MPSRVSNKKKCPKSKLVNPKTGRCVKRSGRIGQSILKKSKRHIQTKSSKKLTKLRKTQKGGADNVELDENTEYIITLRPVITDKDTGVAKELRDIDMDKVVNWWANWLQRKVDLGEIRDFSLNDLDNEGLVSFNITFTEFGVINFSMEMYDDKGIDVGLDDFMIDGLDELFDVTYCMSYQDLDMKVL